MIQDLVWERTKQRRKIEEIALRLSDGFFPLSLREVSLHAGSVLGGINGYIVLFGFRYEILYIFFILGVSTILKHVSSQYRE